MFCPLIYKKIVISLSFSHSILFCFILILFFLVVDIVLFFFAALLLVDEFFYFSQIHFELICFRLFSTIMFLNSPSQIPTLPLITMAKWNLSIVKIHRSEYISFKTSRKIIKVLQMLTRSVSPTWRDLMT